MSSYLASLFGYNETDEFTLADGHVFVDVNDKDSDDEQIYFESFSNEIDAVTHGKGLNEEESHPVEKNDLEEQYLQVLRETMKGAGRWAFGITALEVWTFNHEENLLHRANGGWWRDHAFQDCHSLARLEDTSLKDHMPPDPVVPGVGAAGTLWAEVAGHTGLAAWRDLAQIANDPDQQPHARLKLLAEVFGLVTAMSFDSKSSGTKGMVIFYARRSVNISKISSESNLMYLRTSADLIGAVASWEKSRMNAINERKGDLKKVMIRVKNKILSLKRLGLLEGILDAPPQSKPFNHENLKRTSTVHKMQRMISTAFLAGSDKVVTTVRKYLGGGQLPPPAMSASMCVFAFIGSFLSLLTVSRINQAILLNSSGDLSILMGPLGALVTCHYGLTNAPASQPRNSLFAVFTQVLIAQACTLIPEEYLPVWIRIALVPAFTLSLALALGFPHPPATGAAVIFSSMASPAWLSMLFLLLGYIIAITFAVVFINLSPSRTFPLYWAFVPTGLFKRKKSIEETE